MDIRQIKYFVTVAEEQSFSKAASIHYITQSALSRQIQKLETELDNQLFDRGARLQLTRAGEAFLPEAIKMLKLLDHAVEKLDHLKNRKSKVIRLGFMPFAMLTVLPSVISFLEEQFVNHELQIMEYFVHQKVVMALLNGDVDIIFHYPPLDHTRLRSEIIYSEKTIAILPGDHPAADKPLLHSTDFYNQTLIMPMDDANPELMSRFWQLIEYHNIKPRDVKRVSPHHARLALVGDGEGITFDGVSVKKLNMPNVVYKDIHPSVMQEAHVAMAWHEDFKFDYVKAILGHFSQHT